MLTVGSAVSSALGSESLQFAWLLKLGDDLHYTNHAQDIVLGAETYSASGDLLRLPSITRERKIKLQSVTLEFSNADNVMAYAMRHRYDPVGETYEAYDRTGDPCEILLVMLNTNGDVIGGEAISLYKGAFDSWSEQDTENSATLTVKITSPWSKPNLTAGRTTSDNNQQDTFPGDQFFEFAHEEKNTIGWGAEA